MSRPSPVPLANLAALLCLAALTLLAPLSHASGGSVSGTSSSGKGRGSTRGPGGHGKSGLGGVFSPSDRIREASTSRAEVTDSPTTVKAHTWNYDVGIASYSHDASDSLLSDAVEFVPVGLTYGVTDRLEFTVSASPYGADMLRNTVAGTTVRSSGVGGYGARVKMCWAGTDSSRFAIGSSLFGSFAPSSDGVTPKPDGGLRVPVRIEIGGGFQLGLMGEVDMRNDPDGVKQHAEYVESLNLSHDLREGVSGFVELVNASSALANQPSLTAVDAGLSWDVLPYLGLSGALTYGRSDGRGDVGVLAGLGIHLSR